MKKFVKLLSLGFLAFSIGACSCNKDKVYETRLDNSETIFSGNKTSMTLTTQDIYEYIRENEKENISRDFLRMVMGNILDISNNQTNKSTFDIKVKQYFQDNYLNNEEYKINGVFNEDLLADSLESELYIIDKVNKPTSGATFELGLKYDYSDFIKRDSDLEYTFYLEMLKENYILNHKASTLNDSQSRVISIFSTDDIKEMEDIVDGLFEGQYATLEAVAESKKQEEIEEIGRQYCENLGFANEYYEGTCTANDSSTIYDESFHDFTVCANGVLCTPSQGLEYKVQLIREKEYVIEEVVNNETTDILYQDALYQLFRSDVTDHLYKVIDSEDKFLINGLYNSEDDFKRRDIILSNGTSGPYYLVTVRVVDSNTISVEDKEKALSLLLNKVNETTVIMQYLKDLNIEINDPELKESFNTLLGE